MRTQLHDGWQLAWFDSFDPSDATATTRADWRPARVPGTVQASAFGIPVPELYRRDNITRVQWMAEKTWVYRTQLAVPGAGGRQITLRFCGLDYRYRVLIDGQEAAAGEGMFHPVEIDLTSHAGKTVEVLVVLLPPPRGRNEYKETLKAKFSSGWDFAPELSSIGIWDDVELSINPPTHVTDAWIDTTLQNTQRALVRVHATFSRPATGWVRVSLHGTTRRVPISDARHIVVPVEVFSPQLWWPNGYGEPTLHELKIELELPGEESSEFTQRVGLRELRRVPAHGQRPEDIPLQFVVNGVPVWLNGVNWVPPDACVGEITNEHYDRFLPKFAEAHVNTVRVWGGGLREKRYFYDRCDELGLMVMQEFPIACGLGMTRDERTLAMLKREAEAIARTLRPHPCVFCFTGGNENYHYWDMLDSDDPFLQHAAEQVVGKDGKWNRQWQLGADRYDEPAHLVLGSVAAELAPHVLYQNTSAMEGEGEVHGIWTWNPRVGDHRYRMFKTPHDYWLAADQHLYSEASVSSIANAETISFVLGEKQLPAALPSVDDPVWQLHHAFKGAWDKYDYLWLDIPSTEEIFGKIETLEQLVRFNQYLQCEGARFMIEELRRKQPRTSGVIWWGVNEPWPGLAGNALIDYFGREKAAWAYVANAYKPTILSLRYRTLGLRKLDAELWISHNGRGPFEGFYEVTAESSDGATRDAYEGRVSIAQPGVSQELRRLLPIRQKPSDFVTITLKLYDAAGAMVHENIYRFGNLRASIGS